MMISGLMITTRHRVRYPKADRIARPGLANEGMCLLAIGPHISPGYRNVVRRRYRQFRQAGVAPFTARQATCDLLACGQYAQAYRRDDKT